MEISGKTQNEIKRSLGKEAATLIEDGMIVGLGSGTTATFFIESLIERKKLGLEIRAVSSSKKSLEHAKSGGIPVLDINSIEEIDITIDGADEVDPQNRLIKGGGGAHVREKILASSSKEMIVIVDESKLVPTLGKFGLPVEILPFGYLATIRKLNGLGYFGKLRRQNDDNLFVTDNGNYLYDIHQPTFYVKPEEDHLIITEIPGVIDTGFFFNLASRILVGYRDGQIRFRE